MLPHKAFGFSLYTQLSRSIAETMIDDEDNTTRKCTLKACVDMLQRGRSSECVCVVGLSPKIEVECMTGFHTCNHTVLTCWPGVLCSCCPTAILQTQCELLIEPLHPHTDTNAGIKKEKKIKPFYMWSTNFDGLLIDLAGGALRKKHFF